MAKKATLESLAAVMSKGFASAAKKFTALAEDISDIKSTMTTKVDIARLDTKLDSVETSDLILPEMVRLKAPLGISHVQVMSGHQFGVIDGYVSVRKDDVAPLLGAAFERT